MSIDSHISDVNDSSQYETKFSEPILDANNASSHVRDEEYWEHSIEVTTLSLSLIQEGNHTQNHVENLNSFPNTAASDRHQLDLGMVLSPFPDLKDALDDLSEVESEASEENFPIPSLLAQTNSRKLLPRLYAIKPCRFEVYPTPDGEVAIDAKWTAGSSLILLCDSRGGALCLVNNRGSNRRASYSNVDALPDGFIREAMIELADSE